MSKKMQGVKMTEERNEDCLACNQMVTPFLKCEKHQKEKKMTEQKIRLKDLSIWLKIAVMWAWIYLILFSIAFIYGFWQGLG